MKKPTALAFGVMLASMGKTYGTDDASKSFSVEPSTQQTLVDKVTESNDFLKQINYVLVDELKGQKVVGSVNQVPGKRTDTSDGVTKRQPQNILNMGSKGYELHKREFDTFLPYATMDVWAKFKDFKQRYSAWVIKAKGSAIITVGWYGESIAVDSDPVANPMGQDLDKGWIQLLREYNSGQQFFDEGGTENEIRIGTDGDFPNLDSAVQSLKDMIDPLHLDNETVAIIGDDLISEEKQRLYEEYGSQPTEKEKVETEAVTKMYGGLPRKRVPGFPGRGILITALSNLSFYEQEGSQRKQVKDNPEQDRVDNFDSSNSGYVVENEEAAAALEFKNVKLPDGSGGWA